MASACQGNCPLGFFFLRNAMASGRRLPASGGQFQEPVNWKLDPQAYQSEAYWRFVPLHRKNSSDASPGDANGPLTNVCLPGFWHNTFDIRVPSDNLVMELPGGDQFRHIIKGSSLAAQLVLLHTPDLEAHGPIIQKLTSMAWHGT